MFYEQNHQARRVYPMCQEIQPSVRRNRMLVLDMCPYGCTMDA